MLSATGSNPKKKTGPLEVVAKAAAFSSAAAASSNADDDKEGSDNDLKESSESKESCSMELAGRHRCVPRILSAVVLLLPSSTILQRVLKQG